MIANQLKTRVMNTLVVAGAALFAIAFTAQAQVKTETKTAAVAAPTKQIKVERGEIVYVSGNSVVVKMEDGTLRHFDNVPESTTVTVDGKQLNVHQLQPGMKVEKQTITTTTPKMITTVKTVTGKVWYVNPPNTVILTMENGKNQSFKIPNGQKFNVNGQMVDAFGLKKGMMVDAQQVIEQPATVVAQEIKRTGITPPPPPAPKADVPILIASAPAPAPTPVEAAAPETAPKKLPKTGSYLPLIALLGVLSIGLGLGLKALRLRTT